MSYEEWYAEHLEYINTEQWAEVQRIVRRRDKNKCRDCGCTAKLMDVHHDTYLPEWYKQGGEQEAKKCRLLCRRCHSQYDGTKRRENIPTPKTEPKTNPDVIKLFRLVELHKEVTAEVNWEYEMGYIHDQHEVGPEIVRRWNVQAEKLGYV